MTALTMRPRTDGDRAAVERLKDATGTRSAARSRTSRTVLSAIVAAEAGLVGAQADRASALEAAAAALTARDWPNDATLVIETDLEASAPATQ